MHQLSINTKKTFMSSPKQHTGLPVLGVVAGGLGIGGSLGMLHAISSDTMFNDPNAGSSYIASPSQTITVSDLELQEDFSFPVNSMSHLGDHHNFLVVFGAKVKWNQAQLGAKVLANILNTQVSLVHNGSVNVPLDFVREILNLLHLPLWGTGHDPTIKALESQLLNYLTNPQNIKPLVLIGHSAGTSSIVNAIENIYKDYPQLHDKLKSLIKMQLWGSPESIDKLNKLKKTFNVSLYNRPNDYVVKSFQDHSWYNGFGLIPNLIRMIHYRRWYPYDHKVILYLKDFQDKFNSSLLKKNP